MKINRIIIIPLMILIAVSISACDGQFELFQEKETTAPSQEVQKTEAHVHEFSEWETVVAPTCTRSGIAKRSCLGCDRSEEKLLTTVEHTLVKTVVAPTCTDDGYTLLKCDCGYEEKHEIKPKLEHKFVKTVVAPTCTDDGYTLFKCDCGHEEKTEIISELGHTFTHTVVPPTCEDDGYTEHSCTVCSHSYSDTIVDATGHSYKITERIYPTILTKGKMSYLCHCSSSYTEYISYSDILPSAYVSSSTVLANGIDVSRWNHNIDANNTYLPIDWDAVKASGVDFVILKAGSTTGGIEPTFEMDYAGARAAGLEIGAYFYTYSKTVDEVKNDVKNLLGWLEGKKFEYPIYFDLEDPSIEDLPQTVISDMCAEFISMLQANGYYAGLYSNHNWLHNILDKETVFSTYEVWYARYPLTDDPVWDEKNYGKQLGMWQYSDNGSVDGIDWPVDLNFAYKNYKEIMERWGLNGFGASEAV